MTSPNIFTVGGTVQAGNGLYIERRADAELLALCRAGSFAYVLTPRQLGKSSLMVRTVERLNSEEGFRSVVIDLSQIGVQVTAEAWYLGLLSTIEDQLDLKTDVIGWWRQHASLGITQRLTLFFEKVLLAEVAEPVVIFVDEIDTTLSLDFTDDFFATIRSFYNARAHAPGFKRLSLVLIGVATPGDLIRDPQRTPFNVGQRVDLTDFTFEEALPLTAGFRLEDEAARQVLKWVLKWTGGHPYLTQRLCRALADQPRHDWSEADIDRTVASTFFGEKSRQDDNLRFVRDMLTERVPAAVDVRDLLSVYRDVRRGRVVPDEEQSLIKSHLKLSGIVRRENSALRVRNPIYAEVFNTAWVREHLPVNWTRRLLRAVAAMIILFLISLLPLSIYAFRQAREAVKQRVLAETQSVEALRQKTIAEEQSREAYAARSIAVTERQHAEEARLKAEEEEKKALLQSELARKAAEKERAAKEQAELAEQDADTQRGIAEQQRQLAEEQRQRAEDLSRIATSGQLGALAEVTRTQQPKLLQRSVILARESVLQAPGNNSITGYQALSQSLALMPPRITSIKAESGYKNRFFISNQDKKPEYLVVASDTSTTTFSVHAFDIKNRRELPGWKHEGHLRNVFFSQDKRYLVMNDQAGTATFMEVLSGREVARLKLRGKVFEASPHRKYLVVEGDADTLEVYEIAGGSKVSSIRADKSLYFSPDDRYLVTASDSNHLVVWELASGRAVAHPDLGNDYPMGVVFSQNGRYIAVDVRDGTQVWDVRDERKPPTKFGGVAISFSPDEKYLITNTQETDNAGVIVRKATAVWDITSGKKAEHNHSGTVDSYAFSPDGKYMALSYDDDSLIAFAVDGSGKEITRINATSYAFSPDSDYLLVEDSKIQAYKLSSGDAVATNMEGRLSEDSFSPDGNYLFTNDDNTVRIWETNSGQEVARVASESTDPDPVFSPDKEFLCTRDPPNTLHLWQLSGAKDFIRKSFGFDKIDFSPDGKYLAMLGREYNSGGQQPNGANEGELMRTFSVYEISTGRALFSERIPGMPYFISFSADSGYIATTELSLTSGLNRVQVWDIAARQSILSVETSKSFTGFARISPEGKYLAVNQGGEVTLWDVARKRMLDELTLKDVYVMAFSPNGQYLVFTRGALIADHRLVIRNIATKQESELTRLSRPISFLSFSPKGKYLAVDNGGGFQVFDMTTKHLVLKKEAGEANNVNNAAFSFDENYLVTTGDDYTAQVWDITSGKKMWKPFKHDDVVQNAAFSRTGEYVATVSKDNTARVWETKTGTEVARIIFESGSDISLVAFSSDDRYLNLATPSSLAQTWLWRTCDLVEASRQRLTVDDLKPEDWRAYLGAELQLYLFKGPRPTTCRNPR